MTDQMQKLKELMRNTAQSRIFEQSIARSRRRRGWLGCRSIAITSGKGGVGKSTTTLGLGIALCRMKKRVLVFDGDLGLANMHILMGVAPRFNMSHVINGECTLEQIVHPGPEGVMLLPGASGLQSMARLDTMHLESLMAGLERLEESYDFLLIDGGAGISDSSMHLNGIADTVCVIVTPEPTSFADAYAVIKILVSRGIQGIRVLVNMARSVREGEELFGKLDLLVKRFLFADCICAGILPYDREVSGCIRNQRHLILAKPGAELSKNYTRVAREMCGLNQEKNDSFFRRFITFVSE